MTASRYPITLTSADSVRRILRKTPELAVLFNSREMRVSRPKTVPCVYVANNDERILEQVHKILQERGYLTRIGVGVVLATHPAMARKLRKLGWIGDAP